MRIQEFLQEDNGGFSATRLAMHLWVIGVLVAWVWVSITKKEMADIPNGVIAVLGILVSGKVVQKFGEKPAP